MKKILLVALLTLLTAQQDYDIKVRIVLEPGYHNYMFHNLLTDNTHMYNIGFSQGISGRIYLDELDSDLRNKLINKAPKKLRKHLNNLGSISTSAKTFVKGYRLIPRDFSYSNNEDIQFLYLNWPIFTLGLGPIGFDLSGTGVYYDDKIFFENGKMKFRPSVGIEAGIHDISFSKAFPLSFDITCSWRYLLPSIKFYEEVKFNTITTAPSLVINIKIPYTVNVPNSKL